MQAHSGGLSLSASSYFVPDSISRQYLNYGAAVCEVSLIHAIFSSFHNNIFETNDSGNFRLVQNLIFVNSQDNALGVYR